MSEAVSLPATEREHEHRGWIESWRSFPASALARAGSARSPLFVIAEDLVAPGRGFGRHAHRDMEIVSYVIAGGLAHTDSTGHKSVLRSGELQRMSAGTGIEHSEFNASKTEPVRFLQIWIEPNQIGATANFAHATFETRDPIIRLVGSANALLSINQDIDIWRVAPQAGAQAMLTLPRKARIWAHVATGSVTFEGESMQAGDAMAWTGLQISMQSQRPNSEALVFVESADAFPDSIFFNKSRL